MSDVFGSPLTTEQQPNVATAWLILSHGAFLGASIASTGLSLTLVVIAFGTTNAFPRKLQRLAIAWNVLSFLISGWTVYAISATWRVSQRYKERIFDDFGDASLLFITIALACINLWSAQMSVSSYRDHKNVVRDLRDA